IIWNWGSHVLTADNLPQLPACKAIIRTGSGTDNIPVATATQLGIVVANTPLAHNDAVADHAIGLLFAVVRDIPRLDRQVRAGQWRTLLSWPGWHLHGNTLGLVGFGSIGRLVARKLSGFELDLLGYDPFVDAATMAEAGVRASGLDELLAASDFVLLH